MTGGFASWLLQFLGGAPAGDDTPWSAPPADHVVDDAAAERHSSGPVEELPVTIGVECHRNLIGGRPERTVAMMN